MKSKQTITNDSSIKATIQNRHAQRERERERDKERDRERERERERKRESVALPESPGTLGGPMGRGA